MLAERRGEREGSSKSWDEREKDSLNSFERDSVAEKQTVSSVRRRLKAVEGDGLTKERFQAVRSREEKEEES